VVVSLSDGEVDDSETNGRQHDPCSWRFLFLW
jgi:hypothetical protein